MNLTKPYEQRPKYRYPGAQPFAKEQRGIFFGREKDTKKILDVIALEDLLVLYSKSGVGKSSILNAAVIPSLEEQANNSVFSIRFGAYTSEKEQTPLEICRNYLVSSRVVEESNPVHKISPTEDSLWYYIKLQQQKKQENQFILIFDQFEELFTYPVEQINAFKKDISELLNTKIPDRIRTTLELTFDNQKDWLSPEEFEELHHFPSVKVVMAIRADRLALLNQLTDELPSILKICYELQQLGVDGAEDAILNPAFKRHEGFESIPFDYEDAAIDNILNYLSNGGRDKIESVQLQIICQAMEQKVIESKLKKITLAELVNIDQIYTQYYHNQIAKLSPASAKALARVLIEDGLIFEEEERRLSLYEGQIYKIYGISPEVLRKLVDVHLLRAEPSMRGGYAYEITHDSMVPCILEAKHERLTEDRKKADAALKAIQELELQKLRKEKETERQKKISARIIALTAIFFALLASISAFYAFQQTRLAEQAKQKATQLNQKLEKNAKESALLQYNFLLSQGQNLFEQKNYTGAFNLFEQAGMLARQSNIDSNGRTVNKIITEKRQLFARAQQFDSLISKGDRLLLQGGIAGPKALNLFKTAYQLNVDNLYARLKIEKAIVQINEDYQNFMERGEAFLNSKSLNQACEAFRLALYVKSNDPIAKQKIKDHCND